MRANRFLSLFLTVGALFSFVPAASAAGMIVIDPITPGGAAFLPPRIPPAARPGHQTPVFPNHLKGQVSFGLRLLDADIKVEITDQVAKTYICQTFINDTEQNLAGTYLFPLPEDTTFSSFSLHIDGKPVEGKILEAKEARQTYETIVRQMIDPGLLEYADYKTVRARIFPIPARGTKKVELEYTQVLKAENGMIKYRFPLKSEAEIAPTEDLKINIKLASNSGIRTIWSPSHTVTSTRQGDHKAQVSFAGKDVAATKDFLLYYSVSDKDLVANLLTQKNSNEDGYFLMSLTPPVETKEIVNKDIVLVADTSGSMQGQRIEQTKKALKYLINAFNESDRFSIVRFSTDVDSFKPKLVPATSENKKAALAFVDDMEPAGGTNIGDALKTAVNLLGGGAAEHRPAYLVLMTDGEPTVGETTVPGLLKSISPDSDVRVFDFGVGYDLNTRLLNRLADDHHGTAQYVEPNENIEVELANFYDKIKSPVLSDVKIAYNGVTVKDVYPRTVKDIFAGGQVMLLGKYKGSADANVQLEGTVNGVKKAFSFPLKFEEAQTGHAYLPRLWAMRRIGHLTEIAQDNGDNKEVVDEIIDLSKKYGIISAYTSFLVTDPSEGRPLGANGFGLPATRLNSFVTPGTGRYGAFRQDSPATELTLGAVPRLTTGHKMSEGDMSTSIPYAGFAGTDSRSTVRAGGGLPPTQMGKYVHQPGDSLYNYAASEPGAFRSKLAAAPATGEKAVKSAKAMNEFKDSIDLAKEEQKADAAGVKVIEDKTFYLKDDFWTDSSYNAGKSPKPEAITFGTPEYFDLITKNPGISKYLAVGRQVILLFGGHCYRIEYKD